MERRNRKTPAAAGVFAGGWPEEAALHGGDKIGKDAGFVVLKEFGHPGGHAGVHGSGAEGIDANAFTGLRKTVLGKAHQNANSNLHGIAAQRFEDELVDFRMIAGCEGGHFQHYAGVLIHTPEAVGAFHAPPGVIGGGIEAFLPEEVIAEFAGAPIDAEAGEWSIPGLVVAP